MRITYHNKNGTVRTVYCNVTNNITGLQAARILRPNNDFVEVTIDYNNITVKYSKKQVLEGIKVKQIGE